MAKRAYGKRGEKKSEMLEFRLSWSEKQAFKALCDQDQVAVSARLRALIQDHLNAAAKPDPKPQQQRMPRMFSFLRHHPRTLLASTVSAAGAALLFAAAPSAAAVDTRAAFDLIDADRNGVISFTEFRDHIAAEGFFMTPDAPAELPERAASESEVLGAMHSEFARYDRNHDDGLTHGEFASRYVWQLETSFNAIDRDGDAFIETRELARVMGGIGLSEDHLSRSRTQRASLAIAALDTDGDDRIDFDEYTRIP